MTPFRHVHSVFVAFVLLSTLVLACGDGEPDVVAPPTPVPTTLVIVPSSAVLTSLEQTVRLTATVGDQTGAPMSGIALTWASSHGGVVTVDDEGIVTAVSNGNANVTAAVQGGGPSGSAAVTVAQQVTELRLTPDPPVFRAIGATLRMSADALDANGHPVAGADITWSSSDESVVTVDADGLVTATGNGNARVTASSDPVSATADFSVDQEATFLTVSPDEVQIDPHETLQLTAAAFDANDNPVVGAEFRWLSDDESVATVDATGLVIGVTPGAVAISVQVPETDLTAVAQVRVNPWDRFALVALYNATGGPNWTNSSGWLSDQPVGEWRGVTADAEGRVTDLVLSSNGLEGSLPSEIGRLTHLRVLNLGFNDLTGPIPIESGDVPNLVVLNIDTNDLSGPIPPALANLLHLEHLKLGHNRLTGSIPAGLGSLGNLRVLELHGNQLSGPIPPHLGKLARARTVSLGFNNLTGPIPPELGDLASVDFLGLHANQLTGPAPPELGRLSSLTRFYLGDNRGLTGVLPQQYVSLVLDTFNWSGTGLCSPANREFQAWLGAIPRQEGGGVCSASAP